MTEHELRRRSVLASAAAATGSALAGCSSFLGGSEGNGDDGTPAEAPTERVDRLDKYPRIRVGSVESLSNGDIDTFSYPLEGTNNFITRVGDGAWGGVGPNSDIVAYSSICTHMGCSVEGQVTPDQEMAGPCPCHYTSFDLSKGGIVVDGAATTDLPQIRLDVEGDDIYAMGVDGLVYGQRHNLRDGTPVEAEAEAEE